MKRKHNEGIDLSNILTSSRRDTKKRRLTEDKPPLTDDDIKKEIDQIYNNAKEEIQRRNELLWRYIPLSSEICPKGVTPKKISDFFKLENDDIDNSQVEEGGILQYRIKGFGKRYFNLTEVSDNDTRIKILKDMRSIHHLATPQQNRRLDALSRLLEGSHICVAVYRQKDNTLLITANDINERTRKTTISEGTLIADVMRYFTDKEKRDNPDKEIEIFNRICLASVKSSDTSGIKISDATIKRISDYILNKDRNWKTLSVLELLEIATGNPALTAPFESGDIMRAFFIISDLARDFRKVKSFFSKEDFTFKVLNIGKQNVHAELRMIDYLLKNDRINFINDTHYIGISKLCCAKCELLIKTMNFTMKENKTTGKDFIETRGEHGIGADDTKWQEPDFLDEDEEEIEAFPEKVRDYRELLLNKYNIFRRYLGYATEEDDDDSPEEKIEMHRKVSGILDLKEGNPIHLLMKKYVFFDCVYQLMYKEGKPNPDKKKPGVYLYRQGSAKEIYVLIIHHDYTPETLNLTRLAKRDQQYKAFLNSIEWPTTMNIELQPDDKLAQLLVSSCKRLHFLNENIMPIESILSDREHFLSDTSTNFVSLNLDGKAQYLNIKELRDKASNFSEIYRDLFIINHLLIKQEKKPVSQYPSQSSSNEEGEIEMTPKGILKRLDNIISRLKEYTIVRREIKDSLFVELVENVLGITLETEESSSHYKNYIKIIADAKSEIENLDEINEEKLKNIIQALKEKMLAKSAKRGEHF